MLTDPGCFAESIPGHSLLLDRRLELPTWFHFGSKSYRNIWVNNAGHITFSSGTAWDSQRLMRTTYNQAPLKIAAWWGTVSGYGPGNSPTTYYGEATWGGRPAVCATWTGMGHVLYTCTSQTVIDYSKQNSWQVLLVERGDVGYEDYDIIFNYGSIEWDFADGAGTCHGPPGAGYSMDTPSSGALLEGSWNYGAFLNSNPTGLIHRTLNSAQPGRLIFEIRNGQATPAVDTEGTFGSPTGPTFGTNPTTGAGEPVNTATGSYYTAVTDLALPGVGIPFELTRSYNSADTTEGPLGIGWTHSLSASLTVQTTGDVVARGDDGQVILFTRNPDGSFTAPSFARSSLVSEGTSYRLKTHDQVHYAFDEQGRLLGKRDRNGQGLSLAYAGDLLATVTESGGRTIAFTHIGGRLASVALPDGRDVVYGYDVNGRLHSVTDARGGTTTYTYHAGGRLDEIIDQNQHTVVDNDYGPDGRVVEQRDARGNTSYFGWDPSTETSTYTDPRGNEWKDIYRNNVLVEQVDPLGVRTIYRFDSNLNLTDVMGPGAALRMTYDLGGNLLTRQAGTTGFPETYTYNEFNDVLTYRDGRNLTTNFEYDGAGNLTRIIRPGLITTRFIRDPAGTGLIKSMVDPRAKTTAYDHDAHGNLASITSPLGNRTTMTYDPSGRMLALVDPRGNVAGGDPSQLTTTFTYNESDQLLSITDPLGHSVTQTYDPAGNLESRTDANERETRFSYDPANNLMTVTAPDLSETVYAYDENGNLASRRDANGRTTTFEYDPANRLSAMTTPGGRKWTYAYNTAGQRSEMIDANGNATATAGDGRTTYSYDGRGRLTGIGYSDGTPAVSLSYDGNGNRISMTDGSGTESYNYDSLSRLTSVFRGQEGASYSYDAAGNTTLRSLAASTFYSYDDDGQLASVTSGGLTTSYAYDAAGNLTSTTLPGANGYVETRAYDRAGRLVGVKSAKGTATLSEFTLTLDSVGNPTSVVGPTSATTTKYTYDVRDRLTEVCFQSGPCTAPSSPFIRWTYDAVGNRLTEARPTGTTTYTYDVDDRLTSAGSTNFSYDQNGNQTQAGSAIFTYDLANRLKSTTRGNTTTIYTYDGDGKRLQASTGTQAAKKTNYRWDPLMPVPQIGAERDGNGAVVRRYVYGHGRISFALGNGDVFYFHHDNFGSVRTVTSATGVAQWTYDYEPFGKLRTETKHVNKAPENFMKFTGEYADPTGLYHLRARQYDPTTGRFLARDPRLALLSESQVGPYVYALNRPTFGADPTGECFLVCGVVGAAAELGIYGAEVIFTDKELSVGGVLQAGAVGFVEGATGGVGSRILRTTLQAKRIGSPTIRRVGSESAGGLAGGFVAAQATGLLEGCPATNADVLAGTVVGGVSSAIGNGYLSPQWGFEVRTLRGVARNQPNTRRLWRGAGIAATLTVPNSLAQAGSRCAPTAGSNGK